MTDSFHIERAGPFAELPTRFGSEWATLAHATGASFFQSPQWVTEWHHVYEPKTPLSLLTARDRDGALTGLLPLAHLHRPLHRYLPIPLPYLGLAGSGAGAADRLGPVARNADVARRLLEAAFEVVDGSVYLEHMGVQSLPTKIQGKISKHCCPVIDLTAISSLEELWSKKLRENLRRRARKASEADYRVVWYPPNDPAAAEQLERIGSLHVRRQKTLGRSGLFDRRRHELLRRLASADFPHDDGLWIAVLVDAEETVQAGLIGFQYVGAFYEYKTGWNPEIHRLAPGKRLKTESIRRAFQAGLHRYELLRGKERYKFRLGGEATYDVSVLQPRGFLGLLLRLREYGLARS